MYEGIIALAWADHALHPDEKQGLHKLIDGNPRFTDIQRQVLHEKIDDKALLADVWPKITDKLDRAFLLDIAGEIFNHDGTYCETEQELYDTFLAKHVATLDTASTMNELRDMASDLRAKRETEEAAIEDYADQHLLIPKIERFFKRLVG